MRILALLVTMLALVGFLGGCAAGTETSVEEADEEDASVEKAEEDTGDEEVVVLEEPPETRSETTTPSAAPNPVAVQSEQMASFPEEKEAIREKETVRERDQAQAGTGISISQTAAPDPATVGRPLTFTVTVTNHSTPQRFGFKDFLPPSMTLVSVTPSQGPCGTSHHGGNEVGCTLGVVPSGGSATVEVVATPTVTGTMTNTAVGLAEFTPATPANTDAATITVNPASERGTG